MKLLVENKGILISITVFILALFLYNSFFKPETSLIPDELSASNIGNDLIKTHQDLEKITLDPSLFSSPSYIGLIDFNVAIPDQITGRPNPFEIIGRD